jgi:aminopeptidase
VIHPLHERYAALLVGYCTSVAPGDRVILSLDAAALPLGRALYREVLRAGGEPFLRVSYPELNADFSELAGDELLASEPTVQLAEMRAVDAFIRVSASDNATSLAGLDTTRLSLGDKRLAPVNDLRVNGTRWVVTLYPTPSAAQAARMSTEAYERFVFAAMFLDDPDPAARWRELGAAQQGLADRLATAHDVHITGPGTDLRLSVAGRPWQNSDGKRNMPSGEVFTSPIENSAEGTIRFGVPSAVKGSVVEGVTLRFEAGKVVEAHAERGQDLLDAQLATDDGARYLGELGIGTNPHITVPTLSTLFDEKILGTIHLALGRSYSDTGGLNDSAIHWDLVCDLRDGGAVTIDGVRLTVEDALVWRR